MGKTYEIEQFIKKEIQIANEHMERPSTHHQKIEIIFLISLYLHSTLTEYWKYSPTSQF